MREPGSGGMGSVWLAERADGAIGMLDGVRSLVGSGHLERAADAIASQ